MNPPVCESCHHTPSGRYDNPYGVRCHCGCHDVADAGPELLAAAKAVLADLNARLDAVVAAGLHTAVIHAEVKS